MLELVYAHAVSLITRYEQVEGIHTDLDQLADLITWLEYLGVGEYVQSLLTSRHGRTAAEAKQRIKQIVPHVQLARDYIDQALGGPRDIAFLPIYYAILNLMKACILFGPYHALLPSNRWHGATYDVYGKDSQSLLTEKVTVKRGGAIPLFYRTLTGAQIPRDVVFRLSDMYSSMLDVSAEYTFASGKKARLAGLTFDTANVAGQLRLRAMVGLRGTTSLPPVHQLKALVGFKRDPSVPLAFLSKPLAGTTPKDLRAHVRPFLLYQSLNGHCSTRISGSHLSLPEEFPIALAFFHMSSVVRYKPEFLSRLKDSRFWPVLSTLRRHALYKFLVTFWSFTHQRTLVIV